MVVTSGNRNLVNLWVLIQVDLSRSVRVYLAEFVFEGSSILNLGNRGFGPLGGRWWLLLMLLGISGLLDLGRYSRLEEVVPDFVGAG
jgi:hypothetical protein